MLFNNLPQRNDFISVSPLLNTINIQVLQSLLIGIVCIPAMCFVKMSVSR